MERIKIDFGGVKYDAVVVDGYCVGLDYQLTLAEDDLNKALIDIFEHTDGTDGLVKYREKYDDACNIDDKVCGFATKELITNGTEEEINNYLREMYE